MSVDTLHWETAQAELGKLHLGTLIVIAIPVALGLFAMFFFGNYKVQLVATVLSCVLTPIFVLSGAMIRASLRHYRFARTDDGVLVCTGVFWRSEVFVPRVRIQHTDVTQGPLARRLDLSTLVLHTSGAKVVQLEIPGLRPARARQLRDELLIRELRQPDGTALATGFDSDPSISAGTSTGTESTP